MKAKIQPENKGKKYLKKGELNNKDKKQNVRTNPCLDAMFLCFKN